jgi:hypothetical protein
MVEMGHRLQIGLWRGGLAGNAHRNRGHMENIGILATGIIITDLSAVGLTACGGGGSPSTASIGELNAVSS